MSRLKRLKTIDDPDESLIEEKMSGYNWCRISVLPYGNDPGPLFILILHVQCASCYLFESLFDSSKRVNVALIIIEQLYLSIISHQS